MKRLLCICLLAACLLSSCGVEHALNSTADEATRDEIQATEPVTVKSDDLKWFGTDTVGYIKLPSEFKKYDSKDYVFVNKDKSMYVTLRVLNGDVTVGALQKKLAGKLAEDGAQQVNTTSHDLNGHGAKQVLCYYLTMDKYMVINLVPYDGKIYYIAGEFLYSQSAVYSQCIETWTPKNKGRD